MTVIPVQRRPSGGGGGSDGIGSLVVPFKATLQSINSWTNMPAALTEFPGSQSRTQADLTGYTEARLVLHTPTTAGFAGAVCVVQYFDGAAWQYLDGVSGPECPVDAAGMNVGAWVTLVEAARADVLLRLAGHSGNGSADPSFGNVLLQVR